jgi:hypothetical protein
MELRSHIPWFLKLSHQIVISDLLRYAIVLLPLEELRVPFLYRRTNGPHVRGKRLPFSDIELWPFSSVTDSLQTKLSPAPNKKLDQITSSQISLCSVFETEHRIVAIQGRPVWTKHFLCFLDGQLTLCVNFIGGYRMLGCIGQ